MKNLLGNCLVRTRIRLLGVFLIILSSSSFAQVSEPWFAGPSNLSLGTAATYNGGNFTPNTVVRVQIQQEGAAPYDNYVQVNDDGTVSQEIEPTLEGRLTLSVFDSGNKKLATANGVVGSGE